MALTILVVDDEMALRTAVSEYLEREAYQVFQAGSGSEAIEVLKEEGIDLILLDIGLPDCSGFQLHHEIRSFSDIPVIFMTARGSETDRVAGLEQGADDYLVKPFSLREMVARLRSVLRRIYGNTYRLNTELCMGDTPMAEHDATPLVLDQDRQQLSYFGNIIPLTRCEYLIFETLYQHPGRVFSRNQLLSCLSDDAEPPFDRVIDRHISCIRSKLNVINDEIEVIVTHWGTGYSLKEF